MSTDCCDRTLGEIAQGLNAALEQFEMMNTKANAMAVIHAAHQTVKMIESINPDWPLHKAPENCTLH